MPHPRPFGMDEPSQADDATHALGLRSLIGSAAAFSLVMLSTYVIPPLHRYRPWIPGEPLPIARLYMPEAETPIEGAVEVPETALAALEVPVPVPTPVVEPGAQFRIEPSELEGLVREIEDEGGTAMAPFYAQLLRTATNEDAAITRVAHFGDSTIALDGITMTARELLQRRFGDSGHGFVLAARGFLPYRHFQIRHEAAGNWRIYDLTHLALSDGFYGLGGVQSRSTSGGTAWFATDEGDDATVGTRVSSFQILHQRHPHGGELQYKVDEGEWQTLNTESTETSDASERIAVEDGAHRLSLRTAGHGETRLYGVVMEREGPGVVYDSLGVVGARAQRMMGFDPAHLSRQLAQRETNLVVIAFGGNDADDNRTEEDFFAIFRDVAQLVHTARPEASCLLFAPLDQAERDERGRVATLPSVPVIVRAMRRAAIDQGCAFFDTWTAMGGEGAMGRWFRRSPRLSSGDFRHATPAGYRIIGGMFYRALLAGFARYLEHPVAGAPAATATTSDVVDAGVSVDAADHE